VFKLKVKFDGFLMKLALRFLRQDRKKNSGDIDLMIKRKKFPALRLPVFLLLSFFSLKFMFPFLINSPEASFLDSDSRPAGEEIRGRLTISGAWALYPLVVRWAEEFQKIQPGVKIDVQAGGAGKGVADVLSGAAHLGMVSRELHPEEIRRGAVAFPVARDAVVVTVSARNPYLKSLLSRGLTREELRQIWISGTISTWSELLKTGRPEPIHLYTRSDACGAGETWAAFLGGRQEDLKGTGVYGDPGVAEAVRRDPLGLGYNNLNFAFDPKTFLPVKGLIVLPLDLNNNGQIDPEENFMNHRSSLVQAIQEGKYPSPPVRDLYLVTRGKPEMALLRAFLNYILGEGQKLLANAGYVEVSPSILEKARKYLLGEKEKN
jgi:phosphate transport system substrate-binding protein